MKTKQLFLGAAIAALIAGCSKNNTTPAPAPANTNTGGNVSGEVSGKWTKGSIYHVTGDLLIPEGKSLTIEEGVSVIMDPGVKPEILVKGNLYCLGTGEAPVTFTVPDDAKAQFGDKWGGILAGPTSKEIILDHTILENGGAVTTDESASVKAGFFKATAGEHVPAFWYGGTGKVIVTHSTVRNFNEDALYIEGGEVIIDHSMFYTTGISGGESIDIKSGVLADIAFNLMYSPNTNALKLSNSGDRDPQAYIIAYNNTMLNCGWRRPTPKGGGIWLEKTVHADLYNNLMANDRFGIKKEDADGAVDSRSKFFNTLYFGATQECVDNFQPSNEILAGTNDIIGTHAGDNDPKFVNYPVNTDVHNADFNTSWDFHLQAGSPALGHGKTDFTRHFSGGITVNGQTYASPDPANYIGAYGTN